MDQEFIKYLISQGSVGVLAALLFYWYRKDIAEKQAHITAMQNQHLAEVREMKETYRGDAQRVTAALDADARATVQHTEVLREVATLMRSRRHATGQ